MLGSLYSTCWESVWGKNGRTKNINQFIDLIQYASILQLDFDLRFRFLSK